VRLGMEGPHMSASDIVDNVLFNDLKLSQYYFGLLMPYDLQLMQIYCCINFSSAISANTDTVLG
jgi:hypothetical protein